MAETDLTTWLTVDETAGQIGCSKRTVERLGRAKQLEQRLRRQEGTPPVAVYNPEDVARIALERRPAPAPFVLPAVSTGNGNGHGALSGVAAGIKNIPGEDPIRQLAAAFRAFLLSPPSPPVAERVAATTWIDVPTAADLLGRSEAYVRRLIKAGTLHADRDRCLVVRRKDVEAL